MTARDNTFLLQEIQYRENNIDNHIIGEYSQELKSLESEMTELCKLAREHGFLLSTQGEQITAVEKTTIRTDINVAEGAKTLDETDRRFNKVEMTKTKLAVITVCGLTGACIGGPLGLAASSSIATGLIGGIGIGGSLGSLAGFLLSKI